MKPKFRIIQTAENMWLEKLEGDNYEPMCAVKDRLEGLYYLKIMNLEGPYEIHYKNGEVESGHTP